MRALLGALAATLLVAAPAHAANATFLTAENFRAHTGPTSLVTGNYFADGINWPDVVVVNQLSNDISFMSGSPFGSLGSTTNRRAQAGPVAVAEGPADADNDLNLAIANRGSNSFGIVPDLQDVIGSEFFVGATGFQPSAITTNYLDVIVANEGSDDITYAAGDGTGGYGFGRFPAGDGPSGVVTTDGTNDGLDDVIVSNRNANTISVLAAQPNSASSSGTPTPPVFAAPVQYPAGSSPSDVALGQLDGSGPPDLVVPNEDAATVTVLLGVSTGGYGPPFAYRVGNGPTAVALGDVNGDRRTDIVAANSLSNTVSLLQGNGNGTFQAARTFRAHTRPSDVAIEDMNRDGAPDLVVANAGSGDVSVLLQSPAGIASCHDLTYKGKRIVSCGIRVAGYSRSVRAYGRATSSTGRTTYATAAMTINQRPNSTSTMRLIPRGSLPKFIQVSVTFSIPGSTRRVTQYVTG